MLYFKGTTEKIAGSGVVVQQHTTFARIRTYVVVAQDEFVLYILAYSYICVFASVRDYVLIRTAGERYYFLSCMMYLLYTYKFRELNQDER